MGIQKIKVCDICGSDCDKNKSGYIKVKGVEYATDKDPYYCGSIAVSKDFYMCDDCVFALKELVLQKKNENDRVKSAITFYEEKSGQISDPRWRVPVGSDTSDKAVLDYIYGPEEIKKDE